MRSPTWLLPCVLSIVTAIRAEAQQPKGAQPKAGGVGVAELEGRIAKVEGELDELRKEAANGSQAAQAVAELAAQVTVLRQQMEALHKANAGDEAVRREIDALTARLGELRQEVAALRAGVYAETAPETHAGGGASGAYVDGFRLVDSERFSLRMKGYAQLRHTTLTNELLDHVNETGFQMRRARLTWDGKVYSPLLTYKVQLDFGRGRAELLDYYAEGRIGAFTIRGGQFKTPFARDFLTGAESLSFVDRAVATEEFRYDRDLGVQAMWTGLDGRVEATAGVWNGAGKNVVRNDNLDPLVIVRVGGTVLGEPWKPEEGDFDHVERPGLSAGVSGTFENAPVPLDYFYENQAVEQYQGNPASDPDRMWNTDVDGDGERDNVRVMQVGVDLAFRWRGVGVEAEAYARREDWGQIGAGQNLPFTPDDTYLGGFAQASYFILPARVQVGVRGSWTEVSPIVLGGKSRTVGGLAATAPGQGIGPVSDTRRELSAIVAYYRHRHGIELTGMYSFLDWGTEGGTAPSGVGEQRFIVEAQVGF